MESLKLYCLDRCIGFIYWFSFSMRIVHIIIDLHDTKCFKRLRYYIILTIVAFTLQIINIKAHIIIT